MLPRCYNDIDYLGLEELSIEIILSSLMTKLDSAIKSRHELDRCILFTINTSSHLHWCNSEIDHAARNWNKELVAIKWAQIIPASLCTAEYTMPACHMLTSNN